MRTFRTALPWIGLPLLGLLTLAVYWPGLRGGFLFDDLGNLPALGKTGPIDNWAAFWRYITSGIADPTGRPLTLLTFLLDARDWPANPWSFKCTNLILHLLNGALLYALLRVLGRSLSHPPAQARLAALLGCACWLLHPLMVSTTLYVVQREAMLPATFVMIGLLCWMHGRRHMVAGRRASGIVWCVFGLGGCTVLGTLSKANGALLPIYALVIEWIMLAPRWPVAPAGRRAYRLLMLVFATVPALAILGYLAWTGIHDIVFGLSASIRPWSEIDRLRTEPRVVMDYLAQLWLPRPFSAGLFNDYYPVSTSWWHPVTTAPAALAIAALLAMAWRLRRRHPAMAVALLFYFAGQSLESTSIPLELYFEHRNYVPALLMFWPLGLWLADMRQLPVVKAALVVALPLTLACMTYVRTEVWGDVRTQALIWARINPQSPRAQVNAAEMEMHDGHPQAAARRLAQLLATQPDQSQLAFNLIDAQCMMGHVRAHDIDTARRAMRQTANAGAMFADWFQRALPVALSGRCRGLTPGVLSMLIEAGLRNPKLSAAGPRQDLLYLRGRIAIAEQRPDDALTDFTRALDLQVRPGFALEAAAMLGSAGQPALGTQLLDHYQQVQHEVAPPGFGMPMLHAWVMARQHYWPHELARLRATLQTQATLRVKSPTRQPMSIGSHPMPLHPQDATS